ncbi:MAG: hypothetical protein AMXMBFR23_08090 [Chloroflexota bacterium]
MTFARGPRRAATGGIVAALVALLLVSSGGSAAAQTPPATAGGPPIAELQAELQRLIDTYRGGGEYAVAVTDLQTGETVSVYGDRPHLAACSVNLFVLLQTMVDLQAGRVREEQVGRLMAQTIYASNPVTARSLYVLLGNGDVLRGLRRVTALMDRMGMEDTVLNHPPGFGRDSLGIDRNNWITALDMNRGLQAIWDGPILRERWRDDFLERLTLVKPGLNYLTATVPATVSHKNGFFPATDGTFVDNDAAIVRFTSDGREYAYAISFFSQWVPKKYADIPLGQSLVRTTWLFFQARYGEAD